MSAVRRGAMPTHARCVEVLCGRPVRSGRFTSTMTRPLGNHAKQRNGTSERRRPRRNGDARLVFPLLYVQAFVPGAVALDGPAGGFEA